MKVLIVYDSVYGNTGQIARAIGEGIPGEVEVRRVGQVNPAELENFGILMVGSPTHGGRATPAVQEFLNGLKESAMKDRKVAAFDTRVPKTFVRLFGFAAGRIAHSLKQKGGRLAVPPEGFFVLSTKGPLKEGELERAAQWARGISNTGK